MNEWCAVATWVAAAAAVTYVYALVRIVTRPRDPHRRK